MSDTLGNVGQFSAGLNDMSDHQPDFADFNAVANQIDYTADEEPQDLSEVEEVAAEETEETEVVETEEETEEPEQQDQEQQPKPKRTSKFNELQEELETIKPEFEKLKESVSKFDEITARYGGIEKFVELEESFVGVLLDPAKTTDAIQLLDGLPHGQNLRTEIMFDSMGLTLEGQQKSLSQEGLNTAVNNQAVILNMMLKGWQGVDANITPTELDSLATYLGVQFAENREEFMAEISRQAELYADPKDRRIRELEAKVATKDVPQSTTSETADPFTEQLKVVEKVQAFHKEVADETFREIVEKTTGRTLMDKYRLGDDPKLPAEVRAANKTLRDILTTYVQTQMVNTEAQQGLITSLMRMDKNHPTFTVASRPYRTAVRANVEAILRTLSPKLNGTSATAPRPTTTVKTQGGSLNKPGSNDSGADWDSFGSFS